MKSSTFNTTLWWALKVKDTSTKFRYAPALSWHSWHNLFLIVANTLYFIMVIACLKAFSIIFFCCILLGMTSRAFYCVIRVKTLKRDIGLLCLFSKFANHFVGSHNSGTQSQLPSIDQIERAILAFRKNVSIDLTTDVVQKTRPLFSAKILHLPLRRTLARGTAPLINNQITNSKWPQ